MTNSLLPSTLPIATAAVIAGTSPAAFTRHILPILRTDERGYVVTRSLEENMDRFITPEIYLAAERKRDGPRAYQRKYRRRGTGPVR
jgi:hypothetical protein